MQESATAVRLGAFLAAFVLLATCEQLSPRRLPRLGFTRWLPNLSLTVLNTVSVRLLVPLGAAGTAELAKQGHWGLFALIDLPLSAEVMLTVILLDLSLYWQHRVYHLLPMLWRFHELHHVDNDFDVTTGLRFHPVSMFLSLLLKMCLVAILGADPVAVIIFEVVLNLMAMFNHSNIRIPDSVDASLRKLVVTPDMHRVHHSAIHAEMNSNFGFNLSCWDYLFKSYRATPADGHQQMTIGLAETQQTTRQSLGWLLLRPFRK